MCAIVIVELLLHQADKTLSLSNFKNTAFLVIGICLLVNGLIFRMWASYTFYKNGIQVLAIGPQHKLIQSGPYSVSRNPLYFGIISIAFGFSLILGSIFSLIASTLLIIHWHLYQKLFEEKKLEKAFGEEYRRYKKKVSRWIGKM